MSDGLLLVDKPSGPTSFAVVARVRKRLGVRRVGHGGTLDPMATGLLPILVGEATKLAPYLIGLEKVYEATVRFGAATDTWDADGRVTAEADFSSLSEAAVVAALTGFVGAIQQRPPAYSAIKRDGKRLYQLAREAAESSAETTIVADEREVMVYEARLVEFALPDARFMIRCGKGTYIRSIAHDLGERLGTHGHLVQLRRTRIGRLEVGDAIDVFGEGPLPSLTPLAEAVDHIPALAIEPAVEERLRRGQQSALASLVLPAQGDAARLLDGRGGLIAIAERAGDRWSLARVFASAASPSLAVVKAVVKG